MINVFNLRNPIRGQKGFTLVEVIVVAIIVAALAAVAIPLYNSYVSTSRNNAAANAAGSVASFMGACANQTGAVTPAAALAAAGFDGPLTLTCTYGTPAATTTISVPTGIHMVISSAASPGSVTASSGGGTNQTYNF